MTTLSSSQKLGILHFDHRHGFAKEMLGYGDELTPEEHERVGLFKSVVYEALLRAGAYGVNVTDTAIMVDEKFGSHILASAKENGVTTIMPIEKSRKDLIELEFGDDTKDYLVRYKPDRIKALVRFNPDHDKEQRTKQLEVIASGSQIARELGIGVTVQLIIVPTETQLRESGENKLRFERNIREGLIVRAIEEFYDYGINPDVWIIEGLHDKRSYEAVVHAARVGENRKEVGVVVLGGSEVKERIRTFLFEAREVDGVIGFAIGRTVFWDALSLFRDGKIDKEEASDLIAREYAEYMHWFTHKL